MEVATGAMGSLLPKLGQLLMEEYNLHKGVKKNIRFLQMELESMSAALLKVGEVPRDQLDKQVKLWAGEVRELSYNMEDVVDKFLVRIEGSDPTVNSDGFKGLTKKMVSLFKKGKTHHQIADAVKDIKEQVQEVAARGDRNKVDGILAQTPATTTIDPRLQALYREVTELVGIYGKRDQELIKLLSEGEDNISNKRLKIVSVVGFGGLGKTTLVKAVYDKIKGDFDCRAFVPVGRNPDLKKVLRDILIDLGDSNSNLIILDERQLINKLREHLENKRYLIIIDDIWDEKSWEVIKLAFSNRNNLGSRLITTTRIASISESCCSYGDGLIYQMKPLSEDDSKLLFHTRIFPQDNGCPGEFEEVSRDILKKCGGVPLAIITIASLLASGCNVKPKDEWHILLHSLGRGLTEDASLEEMQRILSFSYYDMPAHLKTCLLYLSMYPEDQYIRKNELIWKWVAENFIQCDNKETRLFELGETYFNELINRNMIQPDIVYDRVQGCRVHDMVLDLICSISSEENFVTVSDGSSESKTSSRNVRRLSFHSVKKDEKTPPGMNSMDVTQVRSITIFTSGISLMPDLFRFDVLRVLDLHGCDLAASTSQLNISDVGNLLHLRYLGLADTGIRELPEEIGNLQFLQVLDVRFNRHLKELPRSVCKMERLIVLNVETNCKWLPDGLGNLTSIEVLRWINASSLNIVQALGKLSRLRELKIAFSDDKSLELDEAFVESVCRLHNIQSLVLSPVGSFDSMDLLGERWVPPRHLRQFDMLDSITPVLADVVPRVSAFSSLPAWIKRHPSLLTNLYQLSICVKELQQVDLLTVGKLPALVECYIRSTNQRERLLVVGAEGFHRLQVLGLYCGSAAQVVFRPGALPRAVDIGLDFGVQVAKEDSNDDFNFGLENLVSLKSYIGRIFRRGVTIGEAKKAQAAVQNALSGAHVLIYMNPPVPQGAHDDDIHV